MTGDWTGLVAEVASAQGCDPERLGVERIRRACQRRIEALALSGADEYARLLTRDAEEPTRLYEELAVCETWFFRQPVALFGVATHLATLPPPIRVLSAPCATGEEPYSIAIALLDAGMSARDFTIDGVDLCAHALERARTGRYGRRAFRNDSGAFPTRHFEKHESGEWSVRPEAAGTVRFTYGDLRDFGLLGARRYHAVFCCHMLIYLSEATRNQVVTNITRWMAPGGRLVVGPSEATALQVRGFTLVDPSGPVLAAAGAAPPAAVAPLPAARSVSDSGVFAAPASGPAASFRTQLARARRLADSGHVSEASAICRQLREISTSESPEMWCLVGVIELSSSRRPDARRAFERALALDPANAEARHFLAVLDGRAPERNR